MTAGTTVAIAMMATTASTIETISGGVSRLPALAPLAVRPPAAKMPPMDDTALTRRIFARSWQCLAHETQIASAGDYVAETIAGVPVLAVRGEDGAIRAFRNACRHRLSPFVADGTGSCGGELSCPYHGWRYALDGRLRAATGFGPMEGFDARQLGLIALPLKLWRGFLFVALSAEAGDFDAWIAPVAARLTKTPLEAWRFGARRTHDVACRWSVYVENYLEGYQDRKSVV